MGSVLAWVSPSEFLLAPLTLRGMPVSLCFTKINLPFARDSQKAGHRRSEYFRRLIVTDFLLGQN
jgi:hypothetical protein